MSESKDNLPEHEEGAEFLIDTEIFADDPLLISIYDEIQDHDNSSSAAALDAILNSLNDQLVESDWVGSRVKVSGKLRLDTRSDKNEFFKDIGTVAGNMRIDEDVKGRYLLADDLDMVMSYMNADIDTEEEAEGDTAFIKSESHIVFSFDTVQDFEMKRDDNDDLDTGEYIMYPDDIMQIKFRRPSLAMIRRTLELEYPRVAEMLYLGEQNPPRSDNVLLERLQNIAFGRSLEISSVIRQGIGRLIYEEFRIDKYAPYQITLNGDIYGLADPEGLELLKVKAGTKLNSGIVGIDMMLDCGEWVPHLLLAEPAAGSDGYEGILVPISSVEKIVNSRPRRRRFGQVAMLGFSESAYVYDFWLRFQTEELIAVEQDKKRQEMQGEYAEFENQLDRIEPPYLDDARNLLVQPLGSEIAALLRTYRDHVSAFDHREDDDDAGIINQLLEESLVDSKELTIGDTIEISGGPEVLYIQEKLTEPYKLENGILLQGKFSGIVEAIFPTSRRSKRPVAPYLSLVLTEVILDEDGVQGEPFGSGVVLVKIVGEKRPQVAKITTVNNTIE